MVVKLFLSFSSLAPLNAADTTSQIITHIDEILKENPLKADQKVQMISIAQDDTISLFVVRSVEGFVLKSHIHKTHSETVYIVKGTGQMFINDKWVDIKPGSLHFNPIGKVHSLKNTGNEPLVAIAIYTQTMKEPDSHLVQ